MSALMFQGHQPGCESLASGRRFSCGLLLTDFLLGVETWFPLADHQPNTAGEANGAPWKWHDSQTDENRACALFSTARCEDAILRFGVGGTWFRAVRSRIDRSDFRDCVETWFPRADGRHRSGLRKVSVVFSRKESDHGKHT